MYEGTILLCLTARTIPDISDLSCRLKSVLGSQRPSPRDKYPAGHLPGSLVLMQQHFQPGRWASMSNEGKSSRDILFPEPSYLNHAMVSPQERTSVPQMEMLTMGPTLLHTTWPWGGSYSATRPHISGKGSGRSRDPQPCQVNDDPCCFCHVHATSAMQPSCSHLCKSLEEKRLWKRWQGLQEETVRGCKRAGRGGEGSSQNIHLEITRSHCTVEAVNKFYFWSRDADSQWDTVTLPCSPPGYRLSVGLPGAEAVVQLHQAYTVISAYSHKLTM